MNPRSFLIATSFGRLKLHRCRLAGTVCRRMVNRPFDGLGNLTLNLIAVLACSLESPTVSRAAIEYVQGTSTNPSSGNPVTAKYASGQNVGGLNVVVVGWIGTTATVVSVTDTKGNTYIPTVGPVSISGTATQRIYYASNIAAATAGANTVTVTFSATVQWPDVRITEYGGISTITPFEAGVSATGSGTSINSGPITTTNANDVLVASDYVQQVTSASDPAYVQRLLSPGGETVEDKIVISTGAYSASATQSPSGWWLMQLVAFRAPDTTPPTAPGGLSLSVTSASQIILSWTASTDNVGVTGYRVERCAGANCTTFAQNAMPTATSYSDTGLTASTSYSYRVRAIDAAGNLSGYSNTSSGTTSATTTGYVQRNSQNPSSGNPIRVTYAAAQYAGDLSVVIVGWTGTTASVTSITDTKGNTYVPAGSAVSISGTASQRIYYAANIAAAAAGANMVTVTFSATVQWPDVRIMEYTGVSTSNPFDVGVSASGTGTSISSGSATTTNANDVLVASDYVQLVTNASDPTYLQRLVTAGGETAEDKMVTSTGAYGAVSTQSASGWWLMQMAAFRGPSADTTPPTAPGGLTPTVVSASQINLNWTASTDNVVVTGYRVERCTGASCTTFVQIAMPTTTSYSDTGLTVSTSYSYRVRATDAAANLSGYSSTVSATTQVVAITTPPTITSPVSGATVTAGEPLTISVTFVPGTYPNGLVIFAPDPLGVAGLQAVVGSTASFSLPIPATTPPGSYAITAFATDSNSSVVSSTFTVDVERSDLPTALSISPVAALLKTVGATLPLTVLATFSGNVQIDVTQSSSLAITSENPNVVTIQNGILVAVGSGQTKVDVVYGSARATLAVTVPAQITGDLNHDGAVDCADLSILQASMTPIVRSARVRRSSGSER